MLTRTEGSNPSLSASYSREQLDPRFLSLGVFKQLFAAETLEVWGL